VQNLLEALWIAKSLFESIITKKWFCPTECGQLQTNCCLICPTPHASQDCSAKPFACCQAQWPDIEEGPVHLCHQSSLAFQPMQAYSGRYSQIMEALAAIQGGMSSMQLSISSMQ